MDYLDRATEMLLMHYWELSLRSGKIQGSNKAQQRAYENDMRSLIRDQLQSADDAVHGEIDPSLMHPLNKTFIKDIYTKDGKNESVI